LPAPTFARVSVAAWVTRVAKLEQRLAVRVDAGPDVAVQGDSDQLDQLLINLVKNAVDASLETGEGVAVSWGVAGANLEVRVRDRGPGVADTANLFVPFFTTKPGGSGIGLALAREIVEAHHGKVGLENRADGAGACATVVLPLSPRG